VRKGRQDLAMPRKQAVFSGRKRLPERMWYNGTQKKQGTVGKEQTFCPLHTVFFKN
jgi:hypothetical protein